VIVFPPVAGAVHCTESCNATVEEAVGAAGAAGTVVIVTEEDSVFGLFADPEVLLGTTLKV